MEDSDARLAAYLVFNYDHNSSGSEEESARGNPFEELEEEQALKQSSSTGTQTAGKFSIGQDEKSLKTPSMTFVEKSDSKVSVHSGSQAGKLRFSHATKSIHEVTEKVWPSHRTSTNPLLTLSMLTDESHLLRLLT